ncbi:MAG: YhbY family RNA-binding protein [Nitrososphaerota archaeon]|nr:YhbY family RNA-binding protein [Candidatus Bathyarchaeota archaeon]MDW8022497.1 YhbY family RNA-binding protein [Nitrososphaerota archaeon]
MSNITAGMRRRIKNEFGREKPTVWVGKRQVSQELIREIEKQLKTREVVKIKILKSALDEDKASIIASTIAKQTGATLIEVRGHTFILYKRR